MKNVSPSVSAENESLDMFGKMMQNIYYNLFSDLFIMMQ